MLGCTQQAKANVYRALALNMCAVWTPYTARDIDLWESVQNRAACWIKSYWDPSALKWSKSSIICIKELNWPSLKVH